MIKLHYEFCDGTPLLTECERGTGSYIEYNIADTDIGYVKIGKATVKLTKGVGRVNFSDLSHGEHFPVFTDCARTFNLDKVSVFRGEAELGTDTLSKISTNKKLVNLEERLARAEFKIEELSEAVCRKLF